MSDPQVTTPAQANIRVRIPRRAGVAGSPPPLSPSRMAAQTPARTRQRPSPPRPAPASDFHAARPSPDEMATMVIAVPFRVEGWHAPAGRRTREPPVSAKTGQIRPAAPAGARNWDPAGKPVTGQPQRRRPDRRSGRVPGSDATPRPPRNRVSKTRVEASLILPADMDGYQGLPTSHSIRAYLAVLYRL